jgi:hypothetical protein
MSAGRRIKKGINARRTPGARTIVMGRFNVRNQPIMVNGTPLLNPRPTIGYTGVKISYGVPKTIAQIVLSDSPWKVDCNIGIFRS